MINTIIFDIGKVLLEFDYKGHLKYLGASNQEIEVLKEGMFEHSDWMEVDRGVLTKEEVLHRFIQRVPEHKELVVKAYETIYDSVYPYEYTVQWIQSLKKRGYQVFYLSNYGEWAVEQSRKSLDFIKLMDGGLFSYEVKSLKPQKYIYEELLKRFELETKNCVFLDDNLKNVESAILCGINAIWFQNYHQAKAELENFLKNNGNAGEK